MAGKRARFSSFEDWNDDISEWNSQLKLDMCGDVFIEEFYGDLEDCFYEEGQIEFEDKIIRPNPTFRKYMMGFVFFLVIPTLSAPQRFFPLNRKQPRKANEQRRRDLCLEFVQQWDDDMFNRQFRLKRVDFKYLHEYTWEVIVAINLKKSI